jgi:streptogrisin D
VLEVEFQMKIRYALLCGAACLYGFAALAQDAVPAAPKEAVKADISPGQIYLMDAHGLSAAEAQERLLLQEQVSATAASLAQKYPDDFGGVWIEHDPVYRIVVAFKNAEQRSAVRETIPPAQRRYVQIRNVRNSVKEREAIADRIIAAVGSLGIPYVSYYEHRSDDVVIEVAADESIGRIRQALPSDLQSSVKIIRGAIPQPMQATGSVAGDYVYPGFWWSQTSGGAYSCSFSFAAKDSQNREGILTGGHCPKTNAYLYRGNPTPHWISLALTSIDYYGYGTKFDYRFYRTAPMGTGAWLWFDNSSTKIKGTENDGTALGSQSSANVIAGYPADGYWKVVGTYGYYDQKVGDVLCKTGHSSGLTCGKVTHGWYTYNNAKGWVETGQSSQRYYAFAGDSGGAVFTSPVNGGVKAAGIVTAATYYYPNLKPDGSPDQPGTEKACSSVMEGNAAYDSNLYPGVAQIPDCRMVHMPIDYINFHQTLTVLTQPAG